MRLSEDIKLRLLRDTISLLERPARSPQSTWSFWSDTFRSKGERRVKKIDWKGRGALDQIAEVFRHVSHSGPLSSGYADKAIPFMPDFVGSRDLFCFHVCFLLVTSSFTHTFISRTRGRIPHQTARISSFVMGLSMNLLTSAKMSSISSSVTSGWSSMVQGVSVVPTRVLVRKE